MVEVLVGVAVGVVVVVVGVGTVIMSEDVRSIAVVEVSVSAWSSWKKSTSSLPSKSS